VKKRGNRSKHKKPTERRRKKRKKGMIKLQASLSDRNHALVRSMAGFDKMEYAVRLLARRQG